MTYLQALTNAQACKFTKVIKILMIKRATKNTKGGRKCLKKATK